MVTAPRLHDSLNRTSKRSSSCAGDLSHVLLRRIREHSSRDAGAAVSSCIARELRSRRAIVPL
eukprot:7216569-Pyramimonas_sp.AAC.1